MSRGEWMTYRDIEQMCVSIDNGFSIKGAWLSAGYSERSYYHYRKLYLDVMEQVINNQKLPDMTSAESRRFHMFKKLVLRADDKLNGIMSALDGLAMNDATKSADRIKVLMWMAERLQPTVSEANKELDDKLNELLLAVQMSEEDNGQNFS